MFTCQVAGMLAAQPIAKLERHSLAKRSQNQVGFKFFRLVSEVFPTTISYKQPQGMMVTIPGSPYVPSESLFLLGGGVDIMYGGSSSKCLAQG